MATALATSPRATFSALPPSSPAQRALSMRLRSPIATPTTGNPNMTPRVEGNAANSNNKTSTQLLLTCVPNDTTVDYDENVTPLYEHIGNSDWDTAANRCRQAPQEAATWVVRYRRDSHGNKITNSNGTSEVLWRFLPIHSACALTPPTSFLRAMLQSHPDGARTIDGQGMLPLHYACGAKCSREVLYLLLMPFPQAALKEDPNGMLPLHYLAQWGPGEGISSEFGVVDMICVATGHKVATARDGDGNTAEMLAERAEYRGSEEVAQKIREFATRRERNGSSLTRTPSGVLNLSLSGTPSRVGSNSFTNNASLSLPRTSSDNSLRLPRTTSGGGGDRFSNGASLSLPRTPSRGGGMVSASSTDGSFDSSLNGSSNYGSNSNIDVGNGGSSYKRNLSIQISTTPQHSAGGGAAFATTPTPRNSAMATPRLNNAAAGPPPRPSTAPAATKMYSSFEDDAVEVVDDSTVIEHKPEGSIEISLSNTPKDGDHVGDFGTDNFGAKDYNVCSKFGIGNTYSNVEISSSSVSAKPRDPNRGSSNGVVSCKFGNNNSNVGSGTYSVGNKFGNNGSSGGISSSSVGSENQAIASDPVAAINHVNMAPMTPRSRRHAMEKLGVSPVHSSYQPGSARNKDRYHSWDGGLAINKRNNDWDGGLNSNDEYQPSPRAQQVVRSFSWGQADPAVPNTSAADSNGKAAMKTLAAAAIQSTPSISGSTWTTTMDFPASNAKILNVRNDSSQGSNSAPSTVNADNDGGGNAVSGNAIHGHPSRQQQAQCRSNSTPRGFTTPSPLASNSSDGAAPQSLHGNGSLRYSSSNLPANIAATRQGSHSANTGFPPLSPRLVAPRSRNVRKNQIQSSGLKSRQAPIRERQERELPDSMTDQERQDRRLLELREELRSGAGSNGHSASNSSFGHSGNNTAGGFAFDPSGSARSNGKHANASRSNSADRSDPTTNISHHGSYQDNQLADTSRTASADQSGPETGSDRQSNCDLVVAGNDHNNMASTRSGSTSSSKHSDTSYGTQLSQHLKALAEAEEREKQERKLEEEKQRAVAEERARKEEAERQQRQLQEDKKQQEELRREAERLKAENVHLKRLKRQADEEAEHREREEERPRVEAEKETEWHERIQKLEECADVARVSQDKERKQKKAERQEKLELQEEISRLESEREHAEVAWRSQDKARKQRLKEDKERAWEVERLRAEKAQSENTLLDEIARLKVDKERAKVALDRITSTAPVSSIGDSSSQNEEDEEEEDHDDGVSKLTFLDQEDKNSVEVEETPRHENWRSTGKSTNIPVKAEIEPVTQEAQEKEESSSSIVSKAESGDDNVTVNPNAMSNTAATPRQAGTTNTVDENALAISEVMKQASRHKQKLEYEKARSSKLEIQVASLKTELESSNNGHGKAVNDHLQVIKSLRESLDRANAETEKLYAKERAANEEIHELRKKERVVSVLETEMSANEEEWTEERKELQFKIEAKEKEWKGERRELERKIKDLNDKCWTSQNAEHKARASLKCKELQWEECRERLEADIQQLKEEVGRQGGSDSCSVACTSVDSKSLLSLGGESSSVGGSDSVEQREDLEDIQCWTLQNDEHKTRALMRDKELQWDEERERLEAEINKLKKATPPTGSCGLSLHSGSLSGNSSTTSNDCNNLAMRMQLENAVSEAENLRKFNSAIRREHGETVAELESELENERRDKAESLSQIVTLQYQIAMLEDAKEETTRVELKASMIGSNNGSDGDDDNDSNVELELHQLKEKLRRKIEEAEESRRVVDDMKLKLQAREREIEKSSRNALDSLKLKYQERERMMHEQLEAGLESIKSEFEERESAMQEEVEKLSEKSSRDQLDSEKKLQQQEVEKTLSLVDSLKLKFQEREKKMKQEVEKSRSLLDSMKVEFQEREKKMKGEVEKLRSLLDSMKVEFQERERMLQQQLEAAEDRIRQLEASEVQQASEAKEEQDQISLAHMQQIRDLKRKIELLHQSDHGLSRQLREANKLRERALQEKEEECAARVRELQTRHEKLIMEKEDSCIEELRDSKKRSEQTFRAQEESYMRQLRDAKKKEKELAEREDALLRQVNEMKDSFSEMEEDIKRIVQEKDEEFEAEVTKLKGEIKRLRKEQNEAAEDSMIVDELEAQLRECKKEVDRQRWKYSAEMNKLNTSIELQKSKEGRLQSHIHSLEKQITDMVNDYESRLQDAFYDNM